jgi:Cas6b C-terminal domain/Cas6b N-terminal domain
MDNALYLIHYKTKDLPSSSRIFPSTVRQYFVTNFPHPFFHNHLPDGKSIYRSRGAPFQFKVINNEVYILALNEGVNFADSFQWPDFITMSLGRSNVVVELELASKITKQARFLSSEMRCYRNISPYMALNQDKHKFYLSLSEEDKRKTVEKGITNHILTAAKWCGIKVTHRILTNLIQMKKGAPLKVKSTLSFIPFDVMFECNTEIPDYIGIGKFVSRGYGTVVQYG